VCTFFSSDKVADSGDCTGGGYIAQAAGWPWDFWLPAVITAASLSCAIFLFPETLFSRDPHFLKNRTHERTYCEMLFNLKGNLIPQRRLQLEDFCTSFLMLRYPSITLPFWYYTWAWSFVNILPAISMASIYSTRYHFKSGTIGLCIGIPLTIGCVLGELTAGKVSDNIMYRLARRHRGVRKPEYRLVLTAPAAFLMPAGIILFGVCVQKGKNWAIPLVGLGISRSRVLSLPWKLID
jgi:hypothetical protein